MKIATKPQDPKCGVRPSRHATWAVPLSLPFALAVVTVLAGLATATPAHAGTKCGPPVDLNSEVSGRACLDGTATTIRTRATFSVSPDALRVPFPWREVAAMLARADEAVYQGWRCREGIFERMYAGGGTYTCSMPWRNNPAGAQLWEGAILLRPANVDYVRGIVRAPA